MGNRWFWGTDSTTFKLGPGYNREFMLTYVQNYIYWLMSWARLKMGSHSRVDWLMG